MELQSAKRMVELSRLAFPNSPKKITLILWDGGQISACAMWPNKQYCEICQGNDELFQQWIEYLLSISFKVSEIELGKVQWHGSMTEFLETRRSV